MQARRIFVAGATAALALAAGLDAQAMGSATHDLARDMATRVYGTDYTGPVVSPCGLDHKEDAKPCTGTGPDAAGEGRRTSCPSNDGGRQAACGTDGRGR